MQQDTGDRLRMRQIPWGLWLTCGMLVAIGLAPAVFGGQWGWLVLAGAAFLIMALFTSVSSLTAERGPGRVTLTSWTPLRGRQRREIPASDIAQVSIERSAGSEGNTFRVALVLASGEQVPLTGYYSGGRSDKEAAARRLSDFLAQGRARPVPVVDGETIRNEQTGNTAGVDWRLETLRGPGGDPVTRWSTAAGGLASGLLILSQISPGMSRLHWDAGPLAGVSKFAFKAMLLAYGFKMADAEAMDAAEPLPDLDPGLHDCYVAFATLPDVARGWLTPARAQALAGWAAAHPVPGVQWGDASGPQGLVLMAAPSGLWLVFRGATQDPARVAEIAHLGAALVAASAVASSLPLDVGHV